MHNYEDILGFLGDSEADEHHRYQSTLNTQNWNHYNFYKQNDEDQFSTIVFNTELIPFSNKEDYLNSKYWQNSSFLKVGRYLQTTRKHCAKYIKLLHLIINARLLKEQGSRYY